VRDLWTCRFGDGSEFNSCEQAPDTFAASDLGVHYPAIVRTWQAASSEFTPYLAFPPEIRKVVYGTQWSSRSTRVYAKAPAPRSFPLGQAALKVLHPAVRELIEPKTRDINHVAAHWRSAFNAFALFFEDRISAQ
jgi:transposase-like protein